MPLIVTRTHLDGLLACPIFAVGFALNKHLPCVSEDEGRGEFIQHLLNVHITIPSEPYGLCTLGLFQTTQVEFEVFIIKIYRSDSFEGGMNV
jgi:hypothetical protein